jgi:hypothetical protein
MPGSNVPGAEYLPPRSDFVSASRYFSLPRRLAAQRALRLAAVTAGRRGAARSATFAFEEEHNMKIYWYKVTLFDDIVYEHPTWHTSKEALLEDVQDSVQTICNEIASVAEEGDEFKWDDSFEYGNPDSLSSSEHEDCERFDRDATYHECMETYKRVEALTKLENFVHTGRVEECGFAPSQYDKSIIGEAPYYITAYILIKELREDVKQKIRAILQDTMDSNEQSPQSEDVSVHSFDNTDPLTLIEAMYDRMRKILTKAEKNKHCVCQLVAGSPISALDYDFCLTDDLNEKLQKAVMLLDEVRFKLAYDGEKIMQEFVNELNHGTQKITDTVRRLNQDPIV